MKYVCLGFIDEKKFAQIPQADAQKMMEECFAYDDELRRGGHFIGGEALDSVRHAVTLRMKNGAVEVTEGPYAETRETLGGILLLEARDLNHAVALMSKHPGVKMGPFEIRPANEAVNQLIALRNAAVSKETGTMSAVLRTERLFSSPPRKVFAAFERPDQLAKWWGPKDFTNTFQRFEFKPGGRWEFVMHGPNGANYPNQSVFREVKPDSKIVIEHVGQPRFTLTVMLTAHSGQTHLTWDQEFETPELAVKLRPLCMTANEQNLDRLESLLASESNRAGEDR
jgi:uncharacterized protein YndB with AHSA1/START domain